MIIVNHYSKYFSLVQQRKFIKYLLVNGEEYYNITKYSSNSLQIYYNILFFSFLIRRVLRQARRRLFDRIAKSLYPEEYAAHFIKSTKNEDSQKKIVIDCNSSIEDALGLEDASNDDSSSIELSYGTLFLTLTITLR